MNLVDIVGKAAPLLGSMLGSPVAGIAVSWIAQYFGADPKNMSDIIEKINADPQSVVKLKQLELDHQAELERIASNNYAIEVDDRKDARDREKTLHDYVPTILAIGFLLNYGAIQFYCVMHNNNANDIISARFQDVLIMIISYYFGSTHKQREII